jgi:hypothetical protein
MMMTRMIMMMFWSPCATDKEAYLEWSLSKDTRKYNEATMAEDLGLLRSLLPDTEHAGDEEAILRQTLGTAIRYLDCADLARCCTVCSTWRGAHANIVTERSG